MGPSFSHWSSQRLAGVCTNPQVTLTGLVTGVTQWREKSEKPGSRFRLGSGIQAHPAPKEKIFHLFGAF
jgi:hypothetical protein